MNKVLYTFLFSCCLISLSAQNNMQLRSVVTFPEILNDVWGYTDTANGKEYALVGLRDRVSIIDISSPDTPQQVAQIDGPYSQWRDIKTYGDYAYVVHDLFYDSSQGLLIIDLSNLPASVDTTKWYGDTLDFQRAHNIWIDENGFAYLWGGNKGNIILDLKPDPINPVHVGNYLTSYVHDGFVRGDTMWTAEINEGRFGVIDVSDKANPVVLATQTTPFSYTHNVWLSNDGKTLFTTDERSGSPVASFDVSDLSDIKALGEYQHTFNTAAIPHNTYVINSYLVNAYYTEGVTIVDANRPSNMIEVGHFDTSPADETMGFKGTWGAYPFFPSQTILASDITEGLFVLSPTYTRACYLEGIITDSASGALIKDVSVEIIGTNTFTATNILGQYKTGYVDSGLYAVRVTVGGCNNIVVPNVQLSKGIVNNLNITMVCIDGLLNKIDFNIFPTIFETKATLKLNTPSAHRPTKIIITNIQGQLIKEFIMTQNNTILEFGIDLKAGMYLINASNNNSNKTIKIIKTN